MSFMDREERVDDVDGVAMHTENEKPKKGFSAKTAAGRRVLIDRNQDVGPLKGDLTKR